MVSLVTLRHGLRLFALSFIFPENRDRRDPYFPCF